MAFKYWKIGMGEIYRSYSRRVFLHDLQRLIPEIKDSDLASGGSGVRAQAVARDGSLLDDFSIIQGQNAIHVLNAPSPGATSSLAIGDHIAGLALEKQYSDSFKVKTLLMNLSFCSSSNFWIRST